MNQRLEERVQQALEEVHLVWGLAQHSATGPCITDKSESRISLYQRIQLQLKEGFEWIASSRYHGILPQRYITEALKTTANLLDVDEDQCYTLLNKDFGGITESFIAQVRLLFPEMNWESIFQALRNVWIMASVQILLGKPVVLTPSVFAYSMLYPLTDNLLDDPTMDTHSKILFNDRLTQRLRGTDLKPESAAEEKVYQMIAMIESEFERKSYPKVYESLLLIQEGQILSLSQQGRELLTDEKLLDITFFKGGTSVLADGFLVAGYLSDDMIRFLFGYGAFLQLADDLQDAVTDAKNRHKTVFSLSIKDKKRLTSLTQSFCQFIKDVVHTAPCHLNKDQAAVLSLIEKSCTLLIMDAVDTHRSRFDKAFVKILESHYALGFQYHGQLKADFRKHTLQLAKQPNFEAGGLQLLKQVTESLRTYASA